MFTKNAKEQEILDQIAQRISNFQLQFLEEGLIENDQENYIDFDLYNHQNDDKDKLGLIDLLQDFGRQHAWLSENLLQLFENMK